jgi:hypothetical protein
VFDDLAVLEPENVDDGAAARALLAYAVDVDNHVIAVRKSALDLAPRVRELLPQEVEEGLEAFNAIRRDRIVLDIVRSEELRGGVKVLPVERRIVEFEHRLLVGFLRRGVVGGRRSCGQQQQADQADNQRSHDSSFVQPISMPNLSYQLPYLATTPRHSASRSRASGSLPTLAFFAAAVMTITSLSSGSTKID